MKVLFLSRYIYDETMLEFTKNKTGFGLIVNDIVKNISELDEVFLVTRVITKGKDYKKYNILKHTWKDVFKSFSMKYFYEGVKEAFNFGETVKTKLKYVYFYLDGGYVRKIIKTLKPDIVHIHGIGLSTITYIIVCDELKIPYIVTLHGLIGMDDSVLASKHEKQLEKKFLQESEEKNIPVSVISSGIKRRILDCYGLKKGDNIKVITNGTKIEVSSISRINIREKYNIPTDNKILLCIGNVSRNKNQTQLVESYSEISHDLRGEITILFLGNDTSDDVLIKKITDLKLSRSLIHCGFIDRSKMNDYWEQADLNIFSSLNDGFGLSIIEGYVYGVPTVTFSDLDAVEDLYNENAMVLVHERSNKALAQGIEKALQKKWEKEWIQEYSKRFSLEKMAKKYNKCFLEVARKR